MYIGERQHAHRFADERRFFAVAFQCGHGQRGLHDGEHQRGQTRPAADIGQRRRVLYIRQHGEAIEDVARDLFFHVAHGGEVMHLVPFVEQVQIGGELRPLRRMDGERQCVQPALQFFLRPGWQHQATCARKYSSNRPTGRPVPPFGALLLKALPAMSRCAQG